MSNFLKKLLTIVITFTVIVTVISARSVFAEPTGNSPAPTSGEATSTPDPAGTTTPDPAGTTTPDPAGTPDPANPQSSPSATEDPNSSGNQGAQPPALMGSPSGPLGAPAPLGNPSPGIEYISISTNKPTTANSWEYFNDGDPVTYTIKVMPDKSDKLRTITIDTNFLGNTTKNILYIKSYPSDTGREVKSVTLSPDKQVLTYVFDDQNISESGYNLSFTLGTDIAKSVYIDPNGTFGKVVGLLLLQEPTYRMGAKITDDNHPEITDKFVEVGIKKDGLSQDPFIKVAGIVDTNLKAPATPMQPDKDLYLGSDGYLYAGTPVGNNITYSMKLEFNNANHTPVDDLQIKVPLPLGFTEAIKNTDPVTGVNYLTATFSSKNNQLLGNDMYRGATTVSSSYQLSTSMTQEKLDMLPSVISVPNQWLTMRVTGKSSYAPYAMNPLYSYEEGLVKGDPITASYKQFISDGAGGYTTVEQNVNIGSINVNVPKFTYENKLTTRVVSPIKVNEEDEPGTQYKFQVRNYVTTADIAKNIAHKYYRNSLMTLTVPSELNPDTLVITNGGNYTSYTVVYEDGTESAATDITGTNSVTINTTPNAGSKVKTIKLQISDRGLVDQNKASGYAGDMYFTGRFTPPASGNEIKMPISIDGVESEKTEVTWIYEGGIDNLVVITNTDSQNNASTPWLLNGDESSGGGFVVYFRTSTRVNNILRFSNSSSIKYENVTMDFNFQTPHQEVISPTFTIINFNEYHKIYGNAWMEYTTNLNPNPRKFNIDTTKASGTYTIPLDKGEVFNTLQFKAEGLKLFAYASDTYRTFIRFNSTRDRNNPGGRLNERTNYRVTTKITAAGNASGRGVFADANEAKQTAVADLQYIYTANVRLSQTKPILMVGPDSAVRNNIIDSPITLDVPLIRESTSYITKIINYPENTKAYIKINEPFFKYSGSDPRITTTKINGETWLIYDMTGNTLNTYAGSTKINIESGSIFATSNCEDTKSYNIFTEAYLDVGPMILADNQKYPFVNYIKDNPFDATALADTKGITANSGYDYTQKRLVKIDTSKLTKIVTASLDDINLFPGKELSATESQYVYRGVNYTADQYDKLLLDLNIASPIKNYVNYTMVIKLPTKDVKYTKINGLNETSKNTIRLRNLTDSVEFKGVENAQFTACSSFSFDDTDQTKIKYNCTETNNVDDAQFILVYVPEVLIGSDSRVILKLKANEPDVYTMASKDTGSTFAESRFFEQMPNQPRSTKVGMGEAKNFGRFIFNWYNLSGIIFQEGANSDPDGIYNQSQGDSIAPLSASTMKFKDLTNNKSYTPYSFDAYTGKYNVYIQPKKGEGTDRGVFNLIYDLTNDWTKYRITTNTSSSTEIKNNNNFPRQNNAQTEGIKFYADTAGFTAQEHISQAELDGGFVDVGLYQNPKLNISLNPVRVKVGDTLNYSVFITGTGSFVDGSEYELNEGATNAVATKSKVNDKKYDIALQGVAETLSGTSLTYFKSKSKAQNYFGEQFEITSDYQVYKDPFVTFHKDDAITHTTAVTGTWKDGTTVETKESLIKLQYPNGTFGKLEVSAIPTVNAPDGYVFAGWRKGNPPAYTSGSYTDPSTAYSYKYDHYFPIFEIDNIGADNGSSDGIPDKYQVQFIFKTSEGGTIEKAGTTIDDQTNSFKVVKTKYNGTATTPLFPDPLKNPANYSIYATVKLVASDVPVTAVKSHYTFDGWKYNGTLLTDTNAVIARNYSSSPETFVATFTAKKVTVNFVNNPVGQKSKVDQSLTVNEGSSLTDGNLKDTLNNVRSTPEYGYAFTGWKNTVTNNIVATTDEMLKALVLEESITLQPQYEPLKFKANFQLDGDVGGLKDEHGNKISAVAANQEVTFKTKGSSLDVPTQTVTNDTTWSLVYSTGHWEYEMECEAGTTGCSTTGKKIGQIDDPKQLEITGNVTFTYFFIAKPYVGIKHTGNGTVALKHLNTATAYGRFKDSTTDTFDDVNYSANSKVNSYGSMNPKPDNGLYDAGIGIKPDTNYKLKTINAYVLQNGSTTGVEKHVIYENGALVTNVITSIQNNTPVAEISFKDYTTSNSYSLAVNDIGGLNGAPCGIIFEAEFELVERTAIFKTDSNGTIDATNTDFTNLGGLIDNDTQATISKPHGTKGLIYPKVVANDGYAFDYWERSATPNPVRTSSDALKNMELVTNETFTAKFAVDSNKDGVPDKYQIKFTYVSNDETILTVKDTVTTDPKVEYITRALNSDGTYSTTNPASPTGTGITKTVAKPGLFKFNGWKAYVLNSVAKEYLKDGANDIYVLDDAGLAGLSIDTPQTEVFIEAMNTRIGYVANFKIDPADGKFTNTTDAVTSADVLIGSSPTAPSFTSEPARKFVGWYDETDANKNIVDLSKTKITDKDLTFVGKFMDEKDVSITDDIVLTGKGFTINYADLTSLTKDDVITKSDAKSWSSATGDKFNPTISDDDLAKIKAVGPEGGIVTVTLTVVENGKTVTRDIAVVVKGVSTNTDPDSSIGITAVGHTMSNDAASQYDVDEAILRAKAKAIDVTYNTEVSVTPNAQDIENIKSTGVEGGFRKQRFTAEKDGKIAETSVNVIIEGTQTSVENGGSDSLALTATGFSLTITDALALTGEGSIPLGKAQSLLVVSDKEVTEITANQADIDAINNVSENGGIFDLTYTSSATIDGVLVITSVTVKVVVAGDNVAVNGNLGIYATDFVIPFDSAKGLTSEEAIKKANVKALFIDTGVDLENIEVDADQLLAIQNAPAAGGIFELTFKAIDPNDPTRFVIKTIKVKVEPKIIVSQPAPSKPIVPEKGRTCQDDGYAAGYVWDEASQKCVYANPVRSYKVPKTSTIPTYPISVMAIVISMFGLLLNKRRNNKETKTN